MTRLRILNIILLTWTAGCLVFVFFARPASGLRNFDIFPNMYRSMALEAQASVPEEYAGRLAPAPGTLVRGFEPVPAPVDFDANPALAADWPSPIAADDAAALKRGAQVYAQFCAACHGPEGHGDGEVTKRGVPPPPSFMGESSLKMSDARMFAVISRGQGNMAPYAPQVTREDRWKAILYIRSMQAREQAAAQAPAPPAAEAVPQEAAP